MKGTHYAEGRKYVTVDVVREGRKYEAVDVIRDWNLSFNLANALTYISRASRKEEYDILDDLRKAKECIDDEIEHILRTEDDLK